MNTVRIALSPVGDGLIAEMPSGHWVNFPATDKGARFLFMLLTEQGTETSHRIATKASPTQSMVDKWLKGNEVKKFDSKGKVKGEELTLEDLGLA